jgi:hypothetical protein
MEGLPVIHLNRFQSLSTSVPRIGQLALSHASIYKTQVHPLENGVEKQPFLAGGIPEDFGRGRRPAQRYFRQIWQKRRSLEVSPLASFRRALTLTVPCKIRLQQFGYLH